MARDSFGCPTITSKPGLGPMVWSNSNQDRAMAGVSHYWPTHGTRRYADRGEFWDAWDIAADYGDHELPISWQPEEDLFESGPSVHALRWRGQCGKAPQLSVRLQADSPWLELIITAQWRQLHELLRCDLPLNQAGHFGVLTHQVESKNAAAGPNQREQARWEATAISWLWGGTREAGLAVLLDGPQGVSGSPKGLECPYCGAPPGPIQAPTRGGIACV